MKKDEVKMTVGGFDIVLTENAACALHCLQEDGGATVKAMVAFADAVALSLAMNDTYTPTDEGRKAAVQMAADMKQLLYNLINDDTYERFR